jgi:hypothetical protein
MSRLEIFKEVSDAAVRYGARTIQWRSPTPGSAAAIERALRARDLEAVAGMLTWAKDPLTPRIERVVMKVLSEVADELTVSVAAKRLGSGRLLESLPVLSESFERSFAQGRWMVATEGAVALLRRGSSDQLKQLVAHLEARGETMAQVIAETAATTAMRGISMSIWSTTTGKNLLDRAEYRWLGVRTLFAKGDRRGRDLIEQALAIGSEEERIAATNTLGCEGGSFAGSRLKRQLVEDSSMSVRLLCAQYVGRQMAVSDRIELVRKCAREQNPVIRFNAVDQLAYLDRGERKKAARQWLETEPDPVIRRRIRTIVRSSSR